MSSRISISLVAAKLLICTPTASSAETLTPAVTSIPVRTAPQGVGL
jgi:hypothetical protein